MQKNLAPSLEIHQADISFMTQFREFIVEVDPAVLDDEIVIQLFKLSSEHGKTIFSEIVDRLAKLTSLKISEILLNFSEYRRNRSY